MSVGKAADFGGRFLLLGAGFSKNFGGRLGSEMWASILHRLPEGSAVKQQLLNVFSFEDFLHDVRTKAGFEKERELAESALQAAFLRQEEFIYSYMAGGAGYSIATNCVELLLRKIFANDTRLIFTLNQDTLIERYLAGQLFVGPGDQVILPGTTPEVIAETRPNNGAGGWTSAPNKYYSTPPADLAPVAPPDAVTSGDEWAPLRGRMSLIKLHGSVHWLVQDGSSRLLITGNPDDKADAIGGHPLIKYYHELFDQACRTNSARVWIIGYGFGDTHINRVLVNGITNHNLRLVIVDPASPEDKWNEIRKRDRENRPVLWDGVSGYIQCNIANDCLSRDPGSALGEVEQLLSRALC